MGALYKSMATLLTSLLCHCTDEYLQSEYEQWRLVEQATTEQALMNNITSSSKSEHTAAATNNQSQLTTAAMNSQWWLTAAAVNNQSQLTTASQQPI